MLTEEINIFVKCRNLTKYLSFAKSLLNWGTLQCYISPLDIQSFTSIAINLIQLTYKLTFFSQLLKAPKSPQIMLSFLFYNQLLYWIYFPILFCFKFLLCTAWRIFMSFYNVHEHRGPLQYIYCHNSDIHACFVLTA